ncbi:MAG: NADH-quinone oxidoreductase subunit C [Streptomycetaceae bacterium]|nr:NADH-quinone oxidoreductase subunit C [Streptomycetaceae bacterium]
MNAFDQLPSGLAEVFGEGATAKEAYGLLTVDVAPDAWINALEIARTALGCTYFDWLSAVDEPGEGFRICAHLVAVPEVEGAAVRRLVLRTTVPHDAPALPTATSIYAGAAWHERETHEMFGIDFTGHPNLVPLLLPDDFEGHPLRKDFVLAARVAKAWPGAKDPGESAAGAAHGGPKRRQMLPPGVPDPNEWGPLKGKLPSAPARPTRGARAATAGERPPRRTRSVSDAREQAEWPAAAQQGRPRSAGVGGEAHEGGVSDAREQAEWVAPRKRTTDAPWQKVPEVSETSEKPEAPSSQKAPGSTDGGETT